MYSKTTLPNSLRLISSPMPGVKSVAVLVMVEAGSRYETKKINGLSHFLEHMAFKGTKKRPNSLAISTLVDGIGGSWNAFTDKDHTGFYIKAESRHLELILDILSDMLQNSLFDQKELDKERGVIIEEINMYEDQPQAMVSDYFDKLLYGNVPLGWSVAGQKKNIEEITRVDMTSYIDRMYHSQSMVIGVAGDFSPGHPGARRAIGSSNEKDSLGTANAGLQNDVEKYFGQIKKGGENKFLPIKETQTKPQSYVHFKKTDQAHLVLGVRALPRGHKDKYVLALASIILGGNMSSRLWTEVRSKRGLAYYVSAHGVEFADCGYLAADAGVRISQTEEAVKVILNEFNKLRVKPPSLVELGRARDFLRGKMVLSLEDPFRVASFYTAQELLEKEIETPEEILKKVEQVSVADIQRVAKDIFVPQKLNLAIIGPFKEKSKFDKILQLAVSS
jgi:predicted Zn-dependent peptidase